MPATESGCAFDGPLPLGPSDWPRLPVGPTVSLMTTRGTRAATPLRSWSAPMAPGATADRPRPDPPPPGLRVVSPGLSRDLIVVLPCEPCLLSLAQLFRSDRSTDERGR